MPEEAPVTNTMRSLKLYTSKQRFYGFVGRRAGEKACPPPPSIVIFNIPWSGNSNIRKTFMSLRFSTVAIFLASTLFFSDSTNAQNSSFSNGTRVNCVNGVAAGYPCQNVDMLSHLSLTELTTQEGTDAFGNPIFVVDFELNDMWGWYDEETDREFLIVGRNDAAAFVEVTDPENPVYLGHLPHSGSRASIWRDMKVYQNYAYIVADGAGTHGVQVFDLTQLRSVGPDAIEFSMTFKYTGVNAVHNIVINEDTGFAYAVGSRSGGETCGGGLHMIDLSEPALPSFAGCYSQAAGNGNTGYTHDAQCVVYHGPDLDWLGKEICVASNETAVVFTDVAEKSLPLTISIGTYPSTEYTHQGWLSEDHRYYFQGDELDEFRGTVGSTRTLIWNIEDLDDPVLAAEHFADRQTIDHNMYVVGNLLFQSQYKDGLRIMDISDPENMVEVGFFDTHPQDRSVWDGSWSNYPFLKNGVVAVSSSIDGLFLLQPSSEIITEIENPVEVPSVVSLVSFYPNPFQNHGTLELELKRSETVRIDLLDVLGRRIEQLYHGPIAGGSVVSIPVRISSAPGGLYVLRISGESFEITKTVLHTN